MAAVSRIRGVTCDRVSKDRYRWQVGCHEWEWIKVDSRPLLTRYRVGVEGGSGLTGVWCLYDAVLYSQAYEEGMKSGLGVVKG